VDNKETAKKMLAEINEADDLEKDYTFSRDTYHELIQVSIDAIQDLQQLSKDSEHPRAFEVLFNGIKHTADINSKLVDLQRKVQVIQQDGKTTEHQPGRQVLSEEDPAAQIAFQGTTRELLSAIDNVKADIIDAEYEDTDDTEDPS
jgi:hypothetical protein